MFDSCICCVACRQRPLQRADHLFIGVLPCACVCVCVIVGDLESSTMRPPRPDLGYFAKEGKKKIDEKCQSQSCSTHSFL